METYEIIIIQELKYMAMKMVIILGKTVLVFDFKNAVNYVRKYSAMCYF